MHLKALLDSHTASLATPRHPVLQPCSGTTHWLQWAAPLHSRHSAFANSGCTTPHCSWWICGMCFRFIAFAGCSNMLQHAPTCPNEMIRYDKNLQPIPMFDHRISSLFIRAVSLSVLYASQLGRQDSLGFFWIVLACSCLSLVPWTLRQGSPHWLWALLAAIFGFAKASAKCGGDWLDLRICGMSEFFVVFFSSRVRCTFSAWWCLVMAILVSDLFVLHRCCYPSSCWVQQQGAEVPSPGASNSLERSRLCDAKRCKEQCPARRITSARYISAASTRSNVAVLYSSYWIAATSLRRRSSQWFGADGLKPFRAREQTPKRFQQRHFFSAAFSLFEGEVKR